MTPIKSNNVLIAEVAAFVKEGQAGWGVVIHNNLNDQAFSGHILTNDQDFADKYALSMGMFLCSMWQSSIIKVDSMPAIKALRSPCKVETRPDYLLDQELYALKLARPLACIAKSDEVDAARLLAKHALEKATRNGR